MRPLNKNYLGKENKNFTEETSCFLFLLFPSLIRDPTEHTGADFSMVEQYNVRQTE